MSDYRIRFNVPFVEGSEDSFIRDVMSRKHLAGKGFYTQSCAKLVTEKFNFPKVLLTPSCSDALEMAAILSNAGPGDEVIIPSFTFVSTANAFALRGASIRYADSAASDPNVGLEQIKACYTEKTKVVLIVHYGGYACDIEAIANFCKEKDVMLIEDAACALDSKLSSGYLGSFGDLAAFSFHETKNITCGKGGMLVINNKDLEERAMVVWEKGTNRSAFFKGEVDKYGWVDLGSSYLNSEIMAAFLWPQLQAMEKVHGIRRSLWEAYESGLRDLPVQMNSIPDQLRYNYHMFYLLTRSEQERDNLIKALKDKEIQAVFHYQALNRSGFSMAHYGEQPCPNAESIEERIIRLPMHCDLTLDDVNHICSVIRQELQFAEPLNK